MSFVPGLMKSSSDQTVAVVPWLLSESVPFGLKIQSVMSTALEVTMCGGANTDCVLREPRNCKELILGRV
jgi:hypothetical protein